VKTAHNTVLITGGSSGIGLALAKRFLNEDNKVIVTGTNEKKLTKVQADLPKVIVELADITDINVLEQLAKKYTDVNILINNAGVQHNYHFADQDISVDLIDAELRTNLIGPIQLIKLMLPRLLAQESAAVVNVSSGLGIVPKQDAPVYCGSKAGLHIFTRSLRWQLETSGVKVFEIIPPLVDTAMTQGRGKGKISPEALVNDFWYNFTKDKYEIRIGKTKFLFILQRILPSVADRIMRPGL